MSNIPPNSNINTNTTTSGSSSSSPALAQNHPQQQFIQQHQPQLSFSAPNSTFSNLHYIQSQQSQQLQQQQAVAGGAQLISQQNPAIPQYSFQALYQYPLQTQQQQQQTQQPQQQAQNPQHFISYSHDSNQSTVMAAAAAAVANANPIQSSSSSPIAQSSNPPQNQHSINLQNQNTLLPSNQNSPVSNIATNKTNSQTNPSNSPSTSSNIQSASTPTSTFHHSRHPSQHQRSLSQHNTPLQQQIHSNLTTPTSAHATSSPNAVGIDSPHDQSPSTKISSHKRSKSTQHQSPLTITTSTSNTQPVPAVLAASSTPKSGQSNFNTSMQPSSSNSTPNQSTYRRTRVFWSRRDMDNLLTWIETNKPDCIGHGRRQDCERIKNEVFSHRTEFTPKTIKEKLLNMEKKYKQARLIKYSTRPSPKMQSTGSSSNQAQQSSQQASSNDQDDEGNTTLIKEEEEEGDDAGGTPKTTAIDINNPRFEGLSLQDRIEKICPFFERIETLKQRLNTGSGSTSQGAAASNTSPKLTSVQQQQASQGLKISNVPSSIKFSSIDATLSGANPSGTKDSNANLNTTDIMGMSGTPSTTTNLTSKHKSQNSIDAKTQVKPSNQYMQVPQQYQTMDPSQTQTPITKSQRDLSNVTYMQFATPSTTPHMPSRQGNHSHHSSLTSNPSLHDVTASPSPSMGHVQFQPNQQAQFANTMTQMPPTASDKMQGQMGDLGNLSSKPMTDAQTGYSSQSLPSSASAPSFLSASFLPPRDTESDTSGIESVSFQELVSILEKREQRLAAESVERITLEKNRIMLLKEHEEREKYRLKLEEQHVQEDRERNKRIEHIIKSFLSPSLIATFSAVNIPLSKSSITSSEEIEQITEEDISSTMIEAGVPNQPRGTGSLSESESESLSETAISASGINDPDLDNAQELFSSLIADQIDNADTPKADFERDTEPNDENVDKTITASDTSMSNSPSSSADASAKNTILQRVKTQEKHSKPSSSSPLSQVKNARDSEDSKSASSSSSTPAPHTSTSKIVAAAFAAAANAFLANLRPKKHRHGKSKGSKTASTAATSSDSKQNLSGKPTESTDLQKQGDDAKIDTGDKSQIKTDESIIDDKNLQGEESTNTSKPDLSNITTRTRTRAGHRQRYSDTFFIQSKSNMSSPAFLQETGEEDKENSLLDTATVGGKRTASVAAASTSTGPGRSTKRRSIARKSDILPTTTFHKSDSEDG